LTQSTGVLPGDDFLPDLDIDAVQLPILLAGAREVEMRRDKLSVTAVLMGLAMLTACRVPCPAI
jgi:hypothetical protein